MNPKGEDKEERVKRLVDFLEKPRPSDQVFMTPKAPRSSSPRKKTPKGEKKSRKKKDPNAPKRPLSA